MSSPDPNRPFDPITGLPSDPGQARTELRARLVAAWLPVLKASGLRYQTARLWVGYHTDGAGWWDSQIVVSFGKPPVTEFPRVEESLTRAAAATGWGQAGVSHGMNVRQGSLHLEGGCATGDGCVYTIKTGPRITQEIAEIPEGYTLRVEELEAYLDPAAPPPTRR